MPLAGILCLLLAVSCLLSASGIAMAGKRRRDAHLDKLRERDAKARWQQLQQEWQPMQQPASPAVPTAQPPVTQTPSQLPSDGWKPVLKSPQPTAETSAMDRPSATPAVEQPATFLAPQQVSPPQTFVAPGFVEEVPASLTPPPFPIDEEQPTIPLEPEHEEPAVPTPLPTFDQESAVETEQVWVFDDAARDDSESKKQSDGVPGTSNNQDAKSRRQMTAIDDSRPKPITSILPYYDYSPDGENPCEFLCPRPDDCPADGGRTPPCPEIVELPDVPFVDRSFGDAHVFWEPSNLFANPLYFEDAALERYGHTHHPVIQPLASLGKFSAQLIGLPYQLALRHPHEHRYALGWYRPGECAPYKCYVPPWDPKAAAVAGAAYTGLIFVVP